MVVFFVYIQGGSWKSIKNHISKYPVKTVLLYTIRYHNVVELGGKNEKGERKGREIT